MRREGYLKKESLIRQEMRPGHSGGVGLRYEQTERRTERLKAQVVWWFL